jgi:hypothetical protein
MSRQRFVRSVLALCCSLALLLVVVAPVLAHGTQAPSPNAGTTPGMQQNPGTSGSTTQGTTGTYHKKHGTKKSHQGTANARQKPGSSTGTNPTTKSKQGTTTNDQKGGVSGLKNGSNADTNSGNPPR